MKVSAIIAFFALALSASADDGCAEHTAGGICSKYVGRSVGATRVPARWIAAFKAADAELEKDWSQTEAIEIGTTTQKN